MKLSVLILLYFSISLTQAFAKDYFVDATSGNDSNAGTSELFQRRFKMGERQAHPPTESRPRSAQGPRYSLGRVGGSQYRQEINHIGCRKLKGGDRSKGFKLPMEYQVKIDF